MLICQRITRGWSDHPHSTRANPIPCWEVTYTIKGRSWRLRMYDDDHCRWTRTYNGLGPNDWENVLPHEIPEYIRTNLKEHIKRQRVLAIMRAKGPLL